MIDLVELLPEKFIKDKKCQDYQNEITFYNLLVRLCNIAINLFEWENLPENCDVEYLEKSLLMYGKAIFVNDSEYGFLSLQAKQSGRRNFYNKNLWWTAYGLGYNKRYFLENGLVGKEAVLIKNNTLMYPTICVILEYVYAITDIKGAIDTNLNATKTPLVFTGPKEIVKSLELAYKKIKNNDKVLFVNQGLKNGDNGLEILDHTDSYICDKLIALKHDFMSEILSFLGIKNVNTEKKERLLVDEVNVGDMFSKINIDNMLLERQKACKFINETFGLNVNVKLRYPIEDEEIKVETEVNKDEQQRD